MIRTHVVVDGSNIATEGRTLPSLRQLDDAVTAFMAEHEVDTITVVVDATFPNRIDQSERAEYEAALLAGELVTPPAGTIGRGDAFILQIAEKVDATVLSNDSFQELHATRPWVFEEGRLIGGKPVPGVGWVFALRTPVRGPVSRRTTREARSKDRPRSPEPRATNANDESQDRRRKEGSGRRGASSAKIDAPQKGERQKLEHTSSRKSSIILNEPLDGVVESFSSHGAYVRVGNALCYAPLKLLGNPAPRTARDVLKLGNVHTFAVFSIDTPRRGIDLALKASSSAAAAANAAASDDDRTPRGSARGATRGRNSAVRSDDVSSVSPAQSVRTASDAARDTSSHVDVVVGTPTQPHENAEEATMAVKKAPAKKAAAKKAPARKTAAKKAPAKKAPAKKAPVRKAAAKKAPARKTAAKKTVAKKAPAKRTAAKKTVAKKAPAKRTAAKKTVAKKAPARRTAAKKAPARKAAPRR